MFLHFFRMILPIVSHNEVYKTFINIMLAPLFLLLGAVYFFRFSEDFSDLWSYNMMHTIACVTLNHTTFLVEWGEIRFHHIVFKYISKTILRHGI